MGTLSKVHFYIPVASTITYPSNGDDDAPSVLLSASPEGETFTDSNSKVWSKNARISVVATDTKAKPHATSPIRWSNSEGLIRDWGVGSNTSYTVNNTIVSDYILSSTNSTYTVSVRDGLLNSTTRNVVVDYIDNVDPDVSKTTKTTNHPVSVEGAEYTKTSVTLAVSANDLGCGLSQNPYSWDGGNTWTNKATYTVNNNSSIRLLVRDGLNNTTERNFSVNNIDKISPVILSVNKNPKEWTSGFTTVSVEASDNVSLAAYPYSWDGGNTWTNNQTKNIFVEGDYNLVVRDAVGNISTSLVTMKKTIINTKPFVPDLPKPIPTKPINPIQVTIKNI